MTRREIEKTVQPIIYECLRKFGEYARPGISPEEYALEIKGQLRPDVRRVSLLISLAKFNPKVRWTGIEHPGRIYFNSPEYQQAFRDYQCSLAGLDFVHEPLPFADQ